MFGSAEFSATTMNNLVASAYGKVDYTQSPVHMGYENMDVYSEMDTLYGDQRMNNRWYPQPYLDHCYAADLPSVSGAVATTAALAEPLGSFIDIEDVSCNTTVVTAQAAAGKHQLQHGQQQQQLQQQHLLQQQQHILHQQQLLLQQQHQQQQQQQRHHQETAADSEADDPWEGSVTRCICDFQHDDGYMICCDRCGVWQHLICMGVDKSNIPEVYLCELCNPRLVDKRRAIRLQTQRKATLEPDSSTDTGSEDRLVISKKSSGTKTRKKEDRRRKRSNSRGSVSATATSAQGLQNKNVKKTRKRTISKEDDGQQEDLSYNRTAVSPRARGRPSLMNHKSSTNTSAAAQSSSSMTPLETKRSRRLSHSESTAARFSSRGTAGQPDQRRNVTIAHSISADIVYTNTYSSEVLKLIVAKRVVDTSSANASVLKEQTNKPRYRLATMEEDEAKGLEATENVRMNQAVAQYTGNVMLLEEYEHDKQCDMSFPYVLCYNGLDPTVEICIDASISTNDARHVRCSCTPNAKVVHVLEQNSIRFYICATKNINEGREITIPFSFDYRKGSACEVKCACGRPACPVTRFFSNKPSARLGRGTKRKSTDDSHPLPVSTPPGRGTSERAAAPTATAQALGGRQRRKSRNTESQRQKDELAVPEDVSADVNLVNKLIDLSPPPDIHPPDPLFTAAQTSGMSAEGEASINNNSKLAASAASAIVGNTKATQPLSTVNITDQPTHGSTADDMASFSHQAANPGSSNAEQQAGGDVAAVNNSDEHLESIKDAVKAAQGISSAGKGAASGGSERGAAHKENTAAVAESQASKAAATESQAKAAATRSTAATASTAKPAATRRAPAGSASQTKAAAPSRGQTAAIAGAASASSQTKAASSKGPATSTSQTRVTVSNAVEKTGQQQPVRMTREQKKIEALEKAFEQIEKVGQHKSAQKDATKETSRSRTQAPAVKAKLNNVAAASESSGKGKGKAPTESVNNRLRTGGGRGSASSTGAASNGSGGAGSSRSSSRTSKSVKA